MHTNIPETVDRFFGLYLKTDQGQGVAHIHTNRTWRYSDCIARSDWIDRQSFQRKFAHMQNWYRRPVPIANCAQRYVCKCVGFPEMYFRSISPEGSDDMQSQLLQRAAGSRRLHWRFDFLLLLFHFCQHPPNLWRPACTPKRTADMNPPDQPHHLNLQTLTHLHPESMIRCRLLYLYLSRSTIPSTKHCILINVHV